MPEKEPDLTVTIIKSRGQSCPSCDLAEFAARRMGADEHVLLVNVELESDLEKRLAGVKDDRPVIDVKDRVK